jgi:hypothetical protein
MARRAPHRANGAACGPKTKPPRSDIFSTLRRIRPSADGRRAALTTLVCRVPSTLAHERGPHVGPSDRSQPPPTQLNYCLRCSSGCGSVLQAPPSCARFLVGWSSQWFFCASFRGGSPCVRACSRPLVAMHGTYAGPPTPRFRLRRRTWG